jgi:hypothetical protein
MDRLELMQKKKPFEIVTKVFWATSFMFFTAAVADVQQSTIFKNECGTLMLESVSNGVRLTTLTRSGLGPLKAGDVVLSVDGRHVSNPNELMDKFRTNHTVKYLVEVVRGGVLFRYNISGDGWHCFLQPIPPNPPDLK